MLSNTRALTEAAVHGFGTRHRCQRRLPVLITRARAGPLRIKALLEV